MRAVGYNQYTKPENKADISPYLPDFVADGILNVDFERLRSIGVKHLLIDLDQTLRRAYSRKLDPEVVDFFATLMQKSTFDTLSIVSNNNRNLSRYSSPLNARVFQPYWKGVRMIRKPSAAFYNQVLTDFNIKPHEAVMIGDKVRLDVAGANRVGIHTVLVRARGRDYWFDYLLLARWREYRTLAAALKTKSQHLKSTPDYIRTALQDIGIKTSTVSGPSKLLGGALVFTAIGPKRTVSIKVLTQWQSTNNWLKRLWRYLKPSWNGEEKPYFGVKHIIEHEAYLQRVAYDAGVRTPKVTDVLDLGDYRFGLATEHVPGTSLAQLPKSQISRQMLERSWRELERLHAAHVAHGDCRSSSILIDTKKRPWLLHYDFAVSSATQEAIIRDNVEFLVSTATLVGAQNAAQAAYKALPNKTLRKTVSALQYSNLTHTTKQALRLFHKHNLLESLKNEITQRLNVHT